MQHKINYSNKYTIVGYTRIFSKGFRKRKYTIPFSFIQSEESQITIKQFQQLEYIVLSSSRFKKDSTFDQFTFVYSPKAIAKKEANINFANSFNYNRNLPQLITRAPYYSIFDRGNSVKIFSAYATNNDSVYGNTYNNITISTGKFVSILVAELIYTNITSNSNVFRATRSIIEQLQPIVSNTSVISIASQFRYAFYYSLLSKNRSGVFVHRPEFIYSTVESQEEVSATALPKVKKINSFKSTTLRKNKPLLKQWRTNRKLYWKAIKSTVIKSKKTRKRFGVNGVSRKKKINFAFSFFKKYKHIKVSKKVKVNKAGKPSKGKFSSKKVLQIKKTNVLNEQFIKLRKGSISSFKLISLLGFRNRSVLNSKVIKAHESRNQVSKSAKSLVAKKINTFVYTPKTISINKSKDFRIRRSLRIYSTLSYFSNKVNLWQNVSSSRYIQRKKKKNHYQRVVPYTTRSSNVLAESVGSTFRYQIHERESFFSNLRGTSICLYRINSITHVRVSFDIVKKEKDRELARLANRSISAQTNSQDWKIGTFRGRSTDLQERYIKFKKVKNKDSAIFPYFSFIASRLSHVLHKDSARAINNSTSENKQIKKARKISSSIVSIKVKQSKQSTPLSKITKAQTAFINKYKKSALQKKSRRPIFKWKIKKYRKNFRRSKTSKKSKAFLSSLEKQRLRRYRYTAVFMLDLVRLGFVSLYSKYAQFLITFFAFTLAKLPRNRKETKYVRFLAKLVKVFASQRSEIIGLRLRFQGRINRWRRTKHIIIQKGVLPLHTYETRFAYGTAQAMLKKGAFGRRLWIAYNSSFHGEYKRLFQKYLGASSHNLESISLCF